MRSRRAHQKIEADDDVVLHGHLRELVKGLLAPGPRAVRGALEDVVQRALVAHAARPPAFSAAALPEHPDAPRHISPLAGVLRNCWGGGTWIILLKTHKQMGLILNINMKMHCAHLGRGAQIIVLMFHRVRNADAMLCNCIPRVPVCLQCVWTVRLHTAAPSRVATEASKPRDACLSGLAVASAAAHPDPSYSRQPQPFQAGARGKRLQL